MGAGIVAEFDDPETLLAAARRVREQGFRRIDAYTPWPVKGIDEALAIAKPPIARITFWAGLCGAGFAYAVQWWTAARDYPLVVGGRPQHAWPAFVLITFETTVLFAGLAAFVAFFALCGLPRLWHPLFEVDGFERASVDRFFLSVDADDPLFDAQRLRTELLERNALRVVAFGEGLGRERPPHPSSAAR